MSDEMPGRPGIDGGKSQPGSKPCQGESREPSMKGGARAGLYDFPRRSLVRSTFMHGPHPAFESLTSRTFGKSSINFNFAFAVNVAADPSSSSFAEGRPVLIPARPATCRIGRYVVHPAFRERLPH